MLSDVPIFFVKTDFFLTFTFCFKEKTIAVQKHRGPLTYKTKLPLQFCMNGLAIIIGQLGLVQMTNRKTGRKDVNKRFSRPFVDKISIMIC